MSRPGRGHRQRPGLWVATCAAVLLVVLRHDSGPARPQVAQVVDFDTPVALGQWPADGSPPAAYPSAYSYPDGMSGKYYPSQVLSVHDGVLDWWCRNSMAATVVPLGYQGFTYGTYTVRMRTERFPGYHIAFMLWPVSDRWTHEIDGPENETDATHPYPAVLQGHDPTTFAPSQHTYTPHSWNEAGFHDYTWRWGPDFLAFYQDGALVTRVTTNIPQEPMRPTLQVEFSNTLTDPQRPDPASSGHVYVDRVTYSPDYAEPLTDYNRGGAAAPGAVGQSVADGRTSARRLRRTWSTLRR